MKKFIIKDWINNTCFFGKTFDSFEDAWEYIYEKDPNEKEDEYYYDDYYVEEVKGKSDV